MLENTVTTTVDKLVGMIVDAAKAPFTSKFNGIPGLVLGSAGAGKSAAFYHAAKQLTADTGHEWQVIDIRALLYDPVELKGIQTIDPDSDYARVLRPDWARGMDPDGHYLIVFEEMTKALPSVQSALMQIILDRRVANFDFGRNWVPFGTGNLLSSRSGDIPVPAALRNRFWTVLVEPDAAVWLDWAPTGGIVPEVESFVRANPELLDTWDSEQDPLVYATPRAHEMLSNAMKSSGNYMCWGVPILGQEAGVKFQTHCQVLEKMPDPDVIFADPKKAPVMDDIGSAFYVGASLAYWVNKDTMSALCTYARRCAHEVAVTMVTSAIKRHPECKETAAYVQFICDYDPKQS